MFDEKKLFFIYPMFFTSYQHTFNRVCTKRKLYLCNILRCVIFRDNEKEDYLELDRISQEEFKKKNKIPLIVILDNVRSLNNVGSVFRTSDAFLVKAVYLCGITATPPHPEIHKTALGAEDSVEWHYFEDTNAAVDKLHEEGYIVYAIEQVENSIILSDLQLNKDCKYAVVLGNEVKGVQQSVVDKCDQSIEIPQFGTKHSLNVSVTAGLVIWDFFKMLR